MPHAKHVFDHITKTKKDRKLAVFDLDSTLYNVSVRTQKIIYDFAEDRQMQNRFPSEVEFLKRVKVHHTEWGLKETLTREGLKSTEDFYRALRDFWKTRFFSSHYVQYDVPYPGASEYVNSLKDEGIDIYYLTGRDSKNMLEGTIDSLRKYDFPLDKPEIQLHMKNYKGEMEDEDFKAIKFEEFTKIAEEIWFFENEPVIIKKISQQFPTINLIWIDTTHSRREKPPEGLMMIKGVWHR